jgi:hypothetical protein
MITLHIREKGHLIDIPGMSPFHTPAKVDISKGDVRTIVGYLNVCNITDYDIIASKDGSREVYNAKDFNPVRTQVKKKVKQKQPDKKLEKRMKRMERMIEKLSEKPVGDSTKNVEQTTNQTDLMQSQILDAIKNLNVGGSNANEKRDKESIEDEVAPFIPEIDTKGMKIRNKGKHKTVKKDEDTDDAADALSKLLNK